MVQKVDWAPVARASFNRIADFLMHLWDEEIVTRFALLTEDKISMLLHHPEIGSVSEDTGFRKLLI